jgi:isoleucyl-tRNA synthetase
MRQVLDTLVRLMAPVLSFTAEEVWRYVPSAQTREESVLLANFPEVTEKDLNDALASTWDRLLEIRAAVTKALEESRKQGVIGHSLDARVRLGFDRGGDFDRLLRGRLEELPTFFITSQVEMANDLDEGADSPLLEGLRVAVTRAAGSKCARCWNYRTSVGTSSAHPTLCAPCVSVLSGG